MGVKFRWLAGGFTYGWNRTSCTICFGSFHRDSNPTVTVIDPAVWKDSILKHGDKKGRQVAQRKIIAAWKADMQEVHPARWETGVTR